MKCRLKKEKSEGFNRRVMGEKKPDKYEREQIRRRNQQQRDDFDFSHLGNYKVTYPVLDNPDKAKKFEMFLEQARLMWADQTGGSKQLNTGKAAAKTEP